MDEELFELCKEVYERTGWEHIDLKFWLRYNYPESEYEYKLEEVDDLKRVGKLDVPLYTSDYLLEKLPRSNDLFDEPCILAVTQYDSSQWQASYIGYTSDNLMQPHISEIADTPLKALLKLTIALSEAGVKL